MADEHTRIFQELDKINRNFASLVAAIGERCPARQRELDDLEKRLRGVEAAQNKAVGIVSILSLIIGSIGAFIMGLIKKGLAQ